MAARKTNWLMIALMCSTVIRPSLAAEPTTPTRAPAPTDLALKDNCLSGQLTDAAGRPLAGRAVHAARQGRVVAMAKTDPEGRFQLQKLQAGVHELVAEQVSLSVRLWTADAAPPHALRQVWLVEGSPVVRGQYSRNLVTPLVLGGAAAAAIIIPLALDHNNDAS